MRRRNIAKSVNTLEPRTKLRLFRRVVSGSNENKCEIRWSLQRPLATKDRDSLLVRPKCHRHDVRSSATLLGRCGKWSSAFSEQVCRWINVCVSQNAKHYKVSLQCSDNMCQILWSSDSLWLTSHHGSSQTKTEAWYHLQRSALHTLNSQRWKLLDGSCCLDSCIFSTESGTITVLLLFLVVE